jgi:CheY-like chemotaxis protein
VRALEAELFQPEAGLVADDSANIQQGDRILLIVENDLSFAQILMDLARERGFKAVVAPRGLAGLTAAQKYQPAAVTLDINLPYVSGWRILDRLKDAVYLRHIPVYVITTDDERERALRMGAMGALIKPLKSRGALEEAFDRIERLLGTARRELFVVDADANRVAAIEKMFAGTAVDVRSAASGATALLALRERRPDLLILGQGLADISRSELIEKLAIAPSLADVPILAYSPLEPAPGEEMVLQHMAQSLPLKDVRSLERLVDEATLFLHVPFDLLPEAPQRIIREIREGRSGLAGKRIMIVDDDIRNIFALTSLLERHQIEILSAETGQGAIDKLQSNGDVDLVLMDIMMPDLDGYDTIREIRKQPRHHSLPIVALTAKAMKGDREKCLEAGASDYIAKPVDPEQLLALLRLWLFR